jgi:hypothetical protein
VVYALTRSCWQTPTRQDAGGTHVIEHCQRFEGQSCYAETPWVMGLEDRLDCVCREMYPLSVHEVIRQAPVCMCVYVCIKTRAFRMADREDGVVASSNSLANIACLP